MKEGVAGLSRLVSSCEESPMLHAWIPLLAGRQPHLVMETRKWQWLRSKTSLDSVVF